jgi:hypothetical protein
MEARRFYLDTTSRSFVQAPDLSAPAIANTFFREDVENVELYFLKQTGDIQNPFAYVDYSANTVKFAVGTTTPAALQTSWTSLSTAITASITTLTNGGGGANEVQRISFSGRAPASGNFSITLPSRAVTVSSVSAGVFTAANHGLLNGQSVTLSSFTISGSTFANSTYFVVDRTKDTFGIASTAAGTAISAAVTSGGGTATLDAITTPSISTATASAIQQAFIDAGISVGGSAQIIVTGSFSAGFILSFANTQANINFAAVAVSSTLAAAPGLSANVSFNTNQIASIISAGQANNCRLEIEASGSEARQTYQQSASVSTASTSPAPVPVDATGFNMIAANGDVYQITIDNNGILTATKQ